MTSTTSSKRRVGGEGGAPDAPSPTAASPCPATDTLPHRLRIEVEWADITRTNGDVFVVGHYVGVLPQNAEWVLDCALSGVDPRSDDKAAESRLMLTDLTRRGAIRGALGDVLFFPLHGKGHVVLAGMGRLGTFKEPQLRVLASSVAQSVGRLFPNPVVCTVLIGAGFGNLKVAESVSGMIAGMVNALASDPLLKPITLRIVESQLDRAYEILSAVRQATEKARRGDEIAIAIEDHVIESDNTGGVIPVPFGFSLMLASLAQACHKGDASPLYTSLDAVVKELPERLQVGVRESLKHLGQQANARQLGLAFRMLPEDQRPASTTADRMSFAHDGARVQSAAITNLTTVSAKTIEVGLGWIDRVVETLRAPSEEVYQIRGRRALRSLVHPDLRETLLLTDPLVLELDRTMSRVPWELIHNGGDPLSVMRPLARQLRTTYSPRPSDVALRPTWKALVIGDPDNSLPAAAKEAVLVAEVLEEHGLTVDRRIGAPDVLGLGSQLGVEPADLYEVLELLQSGEYDIIHFAGHAFFNAEYPDRSGWVFKDDVLTASKLEGVERSPRLIVANACVSAAVSNRLATRAPSSEAAPPPTDLGVVASLADEFFRRGVADYIGTAWEVPEEPAKLFAQRLYQLLFAGLKGAVGEPAAPTLGAAVKEARAELFRKRLAFGQHVSVWAAYQHYGDPTRTLADYRS